MSVSAEDRQKALVELQSRVNAGAQRRELIAFLESRGLPFREARPLVDNLLAGDAEQNRFSGIIRIVLGVIALGIGAIFFYAGWVSGGSFGLRGAGVFMFVVALSLLYRGARYLTAGGSEVSD
jgi:hypothetical protein